MPDLEDVYAAEDEQRALATVLFPRYVRTLEAVHQLVQSVFPELTPATFRLDDVATRKMLALAAERVVMIEESTRRALRAVLQEGQRRGYSDRQIAAGVPEDGYGGVDGLYLNTWRGRSETIARTEMSEAQLAASLDRYGATGLVSRVELVEHRDTDDACAQRNGRVVPLAERPGLLHPNCLPGDQLVWAPEVTGATCREFEGELVTLRTATDEFLTCTPNHPILTPRGWVAAHLLAEGEYVFRSAMAQGEAVVGALHNDQVPARIEEIAGALAVAVGGPTLTVPGAAPQFHGDGRADRDVHVVRADGLDQRPRGRRIGLEQPSAQLTVERTHAQFAHLAGDGPPRLSLGVIPAPTAGRVRGLGDGGASGIGRLAHPEVHGLARRPGQSRRLDPLRRRGEAHAVARPDHRAGQALVDIEAPQSSTVGIPSAPQVEAGGPQLPVQGRGADAGLLRYGAEPSYLPVEAVQLVQIGKVYASHPVYNLETRQGWYVAQGIVTHNCRLSVIPVVDEVFA